MRLETGRAISAAWFALFNWIADIGALACAMFTFGVHVPWPAMVLVWVAGAGCQR
jgi:uncharacterized membrane protein YbhN (UPF0104 family)